MLRAAIELADAGGIHSVSMRKVGQALGVEAMSLYNHVANKDDLLDGIVDLVWGEIDLPPAGTDWKVAMRRIAFSTHEVLLRHPWACGLALSRTNMLPARLRYMEAILGGLRETGFTAGLTYHAYHTLDIGIIGFTLWETGLAIPASGLEDAAASFLRQLPAEDFPYLAEHIEQHLAGFEEEGVGTFAFVIDLILDGLERAGDGEGDQ